MIQSVLQRLTIIEGGSERLVLRELPLLEWLVASALVAVCTITAILGFWFTSIAALLVAVFFLLRAPIRLIIFDAIDATFMIQHRFALRSEVVNRKDLAGIIRAQLYVGEDQGTQIILVDSENREMGLSGYSHDLHPWKQEIVEAINAFLKESQG